MPAASIGSRRLSALFFRPVTKDVFPKSTTLFPEFALTNSIKGPIFAITGPTVKPIKHMPMKATNDNPQNTVKAILSALVIFALLAVYYRMDAPDNIPWLRIGILSAALLCFNLLAGRMMAGSNRKQEKAKGTSDAMTPEQIETTTGFAWSKPLVIKYLGGLFVTMLLVTLLIPAVWRDGFQPVRFILYSLLLYVVVILPFAIRIIYYRLRYGQWLFKYSAAKARELGRDR